MQNNARAVVLRRGETRTAYPDYLVHHGIKGQQWGIRRFQNEDGSLTEEAKKRYDKTPESETWKKSDAEHLSDEELRRRNSRLQAEQQYKNLTTSEVDRERKQFKSDLYKKLLVLPVLAIAGAVGKHLISRHATAVPKLIDKFKNVSLSKIKIKGSKLFGNKLGRYTAPTGPNMAGAGMNGIKKTTNYNILRNPVTKHNPTTFNYRPRVSNSLPKSRFWPRL